MRPKANPEGRRAAFRAMLQCRPRYFGIGFTIDHM
jgi:hypothetical protein